MARMLLAAISGIIFGLGLGVSQMVNPAKVLAFLDIAGAWDPSLAFVMGGAVAVSLVAFRYALNRPGPVLAVRFTLPERESIDIRLLGGAAVFGIGWGLVGFCPGPAIAAFAFGDWAVLLFVGAMIAGMALANIVPRQFDPVGSPSP